MIELFDMSAWPVWIQVPGAILGLWFAFKTITMPYWGPAV